jgi:hypothetical protein
MVGITGVLATGVVIGLGSNPTHEVIKALQRRKGDATIDVPVGSSVEVRETEVAVGIGTRTARSLAEDVAKLESFDATTVRNLVDVRDFMASSAEATTVRTAYVSRRPVRPIRNTG